MSEQELQQLVEAARRVRAQYASTPEQARKLLRDEGVLDENDNLAQQYQPSR
jgi:hypothetical protein